MMHDICWKRPPFDVPQYNTFRDGQFCLDKAGQWHGGCVPTRCVGGNHTDEPFKQAHFDVAFAVNALEYVPDAGWALSNLHQSLKPGGVLVLSSYIVEDDETCASAAYKPSHTMCFSRSFIQWFISTGFEVLHYAEDYSPESSKHAIGHPVGTPERDVGLVNGTTLSGANMTACSPHIGRAHGCFFYAILRKLSVA